MRAGSLYAGIKRQKDRGEIFVDTAVLALTMVVQLPYNIRSNQNEKSGFYLAILQTPNTGWNFHTEFQNTGKENG